MDRRRFFRLGLTGSGLIALDSSLSKQILPAASSGYPGRATGLTERVELKALASFASEGLRGRVALAGDLIPAGRHLRSNLEALSSERVRERLDDGMTALLGSEPWHRLFSPDDIVAIKINGLASGHLSPRKELVWAIVDGLRSAGVAENRIIIWERTSRELQRSGFERQTGPDQVRAYATDALRGGGYCTALESFGSVGSLVSRIVSQYANALINVGVLKDHDLAGISAGMKNLYGVIHNPNRYHDHGCDPYVAEVAALPSIRRTLRLTVIDAVLAQAHAGPAYSPEWIWPCNRFIVAMDPVACDRIAWDLIERARAGRGLARLDEVKRAPAWIATAASLGLGCNEELDLREV